MRILAKTRVRLENCRKRLVAQFRRRHMPSLPRFSNRQHSRITLNRTRMRLDAWAALFCTEPAHWRDALVAARRVTSPWPSASEIRLVRDRDVVVEQVL